MSALLCIHDAQLVTADAVRPGGVLVDADGRIEALLADGERASAQTTIDAAGRALFAGFIDGHVHMRDPGFPAKEDFASGTTAAAIGGVTMVLCMPNTAPAVRDRARLEAARAAAAGKSFVDYGFQAAAAPDNLQALEGLWAEGVVSFEALFSDGPPEDLFDSDEALFAVLAEIARIDALIGIYTGDQAATTRRIEALRETGRQDAMAYVEARAPELEVSGLKRLLRVAGFALPRLLARQVSSEHGLACIADARKMRPELQLAVEVTPHHLHLDTTAVERHGAFALMAPPLRPASDAAAARAALAAGLVDVIGSDHAPHAAEEKRATDVWQVPGGTPGLDTVAPALLDLAVAGAIPLTRVAAVLAESPARLFGLADRKGFLRPGADGDLVMVDLETRRTVTAEDVHSRAGRSPFQGMTLCGWPVLTVLRGRVIAAAGRLAVDAPTGRQLLREGAISGSQA